LVSWEIPFRVDGDSGREGKHARLKMARCLEPSRDFVPFADCSLAAARVLERDQGVTCRPAAAILMF
jgi:hypothetical protein